MVEPFLSIVIPVRNGAGTISSCLKCLENLDYQDGKYEIIVVDNNSSDETLSLIRGHNVKCLVQEKKGQSAARNMGAAHARGEILGFLDADCLVDSQWANIVEDFFLKAENASSILVGFCEHVVRNIGDEMHAFDYQKYWQARLASKEGLSAVCAANFAIRKDVFLKLGGFDEEFLLFEDIEFGMRAFRSNHPICYDPNLRAQHLDQGSVDDRIRKMGGHGYFEYLAFKKHRNDPDIPRLMPAFFRSYFVVLDHAGNKLLIRCLLSVLAGCLVVSSTVLKALFRMHIRHYFIYKLTVNLSLFRGKLMGILQSRNREVAA